MSVPYLGYASESDYHEHYTLLGLLEKERSRVERRSIRARIREIVDSSRQVPAAEHAEPE